MAFLNSFANHIKNGTLLKTARKRLFNSGSEKSDAPIGDTYYGSRAEDYLTKRHQQEYWHQEQERIATMLSQLPKGSSVLDVPFGTGRFVKEYLKNEFKVTGLDASEDMVKVAEKELGDDFNQIKISIGDATELPYPDQSFDYVVCIRFLTHIVNFEQACRVLGEFRRVTRRKLLLQVRMRLDECPPADYPNPDQQIGDRLNKVQLTKLLHEHGFEVDQIDVLEKRETYCRAIFLCTPASE